MDVTLGWSLVLGPELPKCSLGFIRGEGASLMDVTLGWALALSPDLPKCNLGFVRRERSFIDGCDLRVCPGPGPRLTRVQFRAIRGGGASLMDVILRWVLVLVLDSPECNLGFIRGEGALLMDVTLRWALALGPDLPECNLGFIRRGRSFIDG
eukprot:12404441-Karenia_brevis.AAC.1